MKLFSRRRHTNLKTHSAPAPVRGSAGSRLRRGRVLTLAAVALGLVVSTIPLATGSAFAAVETCLTGTLRYTATNAEGGTPLTQVTSNARSVNWELWGQTVAGGGDQQLATGQTDGNGNFSACYTGDAALPSAYVKFNSASTTVWRVVKSHTDASEYTFNSNTQYNTSGNISLGTVNVPSDEVYAFKIVDVLNELYWKRGTDSVCWTSHQTTLDTCKTLTVAWGQNNTEGAYFDTSNTHYVLMKGNQPDSKHLLLHEAGHWLQWQLYNEWWPVQDWSDHPHDKQTTATCAWIEGFADAVASYVLGDHLYVQPDGSNYSFETQSDWDAGDTVEGRVAESLLDLWAPDGPDGGNWNSNIALMSGNTSSNFNEYFTQDRPAAGLSTTGAAETVINNNGIDYTP
ncbi:metalloprotease [Streptomyces sp. NPDC048506]|uniref:metalloprotease n=1 Tax=Streptomyces sp. NPDC048506 TaxID=3155028 RepID=UPI00343DEA5E